MQLILKSLETDLRKVMQPNTATNLRVRASSYVRARAGPGPLRSSCLAVSQLLHVAKSALRWTYRSPGTPAVTLHAAACRSTCTVRGSNRRIDGGAQESKRNQLKDFVNIAGPLGVTHFLILTATETAAYLRVAKTPRA